MAVKDPSSEQTAAGLSTTRGIQSSLQVSPREKSILRGLAAKVAALAARPVEQEKKKLWTLHNDLQITRPLIFCDPENGWNEIIPQEELRCEDPLLRVWEMGFRKEIFWAEQLLDDRVIEGFFDVPYHYSDAGYGMAEQVIRTDERGSYRYDSPIKEYELDFPRLRFSDVAIDEEQTRRVRGLAEEIVGDILTVRMKGLWWWTLGMTWDFIKLRGLENLMTDMLLHPVWVHRMMDFLCRALHRKLDFLESQGLLFLNTGGSYVGSGGFGWTAQLPAEGYSGRVRTMDMWGFAESQETVGVSPAMFGEFIFPYQRSVLERFGLNCYGCCEPLERRWMYISTIPRLRRVSVSPWADVKKMAEFLGNRYIFSLKPSPVPLAQPVLDERTVRQELRVALQAARDCRVEVIMKDNHTLGNNPWNAIRWVRLAREEAMSL